MECVGVNPKQYNTVAEIRGAVGRVGRASCMVTFPAVGVFPGLLTAIVYVPGNPTLKLPGWVLVMARVGVWIFVGSLALWESTSPPPVTVAVLVTFGPP